MFIQHIGAAGLQPITDGDESYISCVEFTVYGFTGSMIPQTVQQTDGPMPTGIAAANFFNAGYVNANTGVSYAAGTAITADGRYIIDTTGAKLALNVTNAGDSDFYVYGKPLAGPAPTFAASSSSPAIATAVAPTYGEGASVSLSTDLSGNLRTSGSTAITGGANDNSTNSTNKLPVLDGTATAAVPTYTEGRQVPRSSDLAGNTRVIPAATEVHLGQIGGTTTSIAPTLAVTAALYAAGNCVGGLLTLTSAMRISGGTGAWAKLNLTDHANQKAPLDILLFHSSPAGAFTDKSAFPTMSVADNALVSCRISIAATDWVTIGGSAYCTKQVGPLPVTAVGSANLFAAMNTSGTPTYAATTDLSAKFGFFCD